MSRYIYGGSTYGGGYSRPTHSKPTARQSPRPSRASPPPPPRPAPSTPSSHEQRVAEFHQTLGKKGTPSPSQAYTPTTRVIYLPAQAARIERVEGKEVKGGRRERSAGETRRRQSVARATLRSGGGGVYNAAMGSGVSIRGRS